MGGGMGGGMGTEDLFEGMGGGEGLDGAMGF
jgi:hypothetical protein